MIYEVAFTCIVLFSLHYGPMRRGVIKTHFAGYEVSGEFKLLPRVPKLVGGSQDLTHCFTDFNFYSFPKFLFAFSVKDVN